MMEPHPTPHASEPKPKSPSEASPPSTGVPLGEAIRRGWDWVVFVWQTGRGLGGPGEILKTVYTVLSLLIRRTLIQWGVLKR